MSALAVLLVLLLVAYVGGLWASARLSRSFGSPSGVEYALLGVSLGPHVLGMLGRGVQATFEPLAIVALGWIALGFGLDCGIAGRGRARVAPMLMGVLATLFVMGGVAYVTYLLADTLAAAERTALALAVGLVSAESTRYGVRRVGERNGAQGPLYRLLHELSAADDAPALLALPLFVALLSGPADWQSFDARGLRVALVSLCAGAAMGALAGWLITRTASRVERWTILLGSTWLSAGAAELVGGSAMGTCFALGVGLSATCSQADIVRRAVARTEGPVLLPALLLAGAALSPLELGALRVVALVTAVRLGANFLVGCGVAGLRVAEGRPAPFWLGLGMQSSGTLSMVLGYGIALRWPGTAGNTVLACSIASTLLGELVGPLGLRRALARAGEVTLAPNARPAPEVAP